MVLLNLAIAKGAIPERQRTIACKHGRKQLPQLVGSLRVGLQKRGHELWRHAVPQNALCEQPYRAYVDPGAEGLWQALQASAAAGCTVQSRTQLGLPVGQQCTLCQPAGDEAAVFPQKALPVLPRTMAARVRKQQRAAEDPNDLLRHGRSSTHSAAANKAFECCGPLPHTPLSSTLPSGCAFPPSQF